MITIRSRVRKYPVDTKKMAQDVLIVLNDLKYADFDLGILLTTNKIIQQYNRDFRHKDQPTDVLAFPYHHNARPGKRIVVTQEEDKNLGDLVISLEYVSKKGQEYGYTFDYYLKKLLIHGICHLLGYDHIKDTDYQRMAKEEERLLHKIAEAPEHF